MPERYGYFVIVHNDAGWHVRTHAANGEPIMTSKVYTRRRAAVRAVEVSARGTVPKVDGEYLPAVETSDGNIPVHFRDERTGR